MEILVTAAVVGVIQEGTREQVNSLKHVGQDRSLIC